MEQFVQIERDLLEQVDKVATLGECFTWMQRCNECVEQLKEHSCAKRPRLSIRKRQSLVARIAQLEGLKKGLERRFIHIDGDYASTSSGDAKKLIWREIDTAFEKNILTGAVINADHIKPRKFLEDTGSVVLEQVQNVIKKYNSVKVNTMFNGEFATGDKRANKSINSRNCELFQTSNLCEWYERHVIEPILVPQRVSRV